MKIKEALEMINNIENQIYWNISEQRYTVNSRLFVARDVLLQELSNKDKEIEQCVVDNMSMESQVHAKEKIIELMAEKLVPYRCKECGNKKRKECCELNKWCVDCVMSDFRVSDNKIEIMIVEPITTIGDFIIDGALIYTKEDK